MLSISVIVILTFLLIVSVYKNVQLGTTVLKMEDAIEECLDVIDTKYEIMTEILERPLFYDSPEVRSVVKGIGSVRTALHSVALTLTKDVPDEIEDNEA